MDGAYTDPAVRQAISESISQAEADRMRGDKIREELYGVKYATPTPSITVGTQVRLTGVVTYGESSLRDTVRVDVKGDTAVWVAPSLCEVIRQPFKRGEVVRHKTVMADDCVVIEDEANGRVLLVVAREGVTTFEMDAEDYKLVSK